MLKKTKLLLALMLIMIIIATSSCDKEKNTISDWQGTHNCHLSMFWTNDYPVIVDISISGNNFTIHVVEENLENNYLEDFSEFTLYGVMVDGIVDITPCEDFLDYSITGGTLRMVDNKIFLTIEISGPDGSTISIIEY